MFDKYLVIKIFYIHYDYLNINMKLFFINILYLSIRIRYIIIYLM
jgi:hypothetical protein